MKMITTLSLAAVTALFIGCGGGGGGGGTPASSVASVSSSASSVASSQGSSSSSSTEGLQSIDARNISGYTVFTDNLNIGINPDVETIIYIFETGTQVKIIVKNKNGTQESSSGTYETQNNSFGKVIQMETNNDQTGDSEAYTLTLDDNYVLHVGNDPYQIQGHPISKIVTNEENGID